MSTPEDATTQPAGDLAAAGAQREHARELQSVLADVWLHSETLVRQELALVKAEYETRTSELKAAVRRGALSLGLFHAAYLTTLATIVLVLAQWLEPWLSSLLVAIGASAGAFTFTWLGKQALEEATAPRASSESMKLRDHHQVRRQRAHT